MKKPNFKAVTDVLALEITLNRYLKGTPLKAFLTSPSLPLTLDNLGQGGDQHFIYPGFSDGNETRPELNVFITHMSVVDENVKIGQLLFIKKGENHPEISSVIFDYTGERLIVKSYTKGVFDLIQALTPPEVPDEKMSAKELEDKYVNLNGGNHPKYPFEMWQQAVAGNFTNVGYWTWVTQQYKQEGLEEDVSFSV